jgi:FkbM family methyltransferase
MNIDLFRLMAERLSRDRIFRRRLPENFGRRPIWISPDARLRYLTPGAAGFDLQLLGYVEKYINSRDSVLDIGGNVGEFALAAAHRAGSDGAVLAVEPDPFLASLILRTSMEPANQDISLNVLPVACSSEAHLEKFYLSARGRASNALAACGIEDMGGMRGELLVPTITVDAIAASWNVPSFIKIDVEGAERAVLEGATHTLATHRPLVLIEIRKDKDKVREIFKMHNYVLFDPAAGFAGMPLTQCLFDTLAVPKERVAGTNKTRSL